jgi:hypothetical protein
MSVAHHESGHAVAGFALGFPITYVSVRSTEDRSGACRFDPHIEVRPKHELDFAVALVAGTQAERFVLGREPWHRTNWFRDDPDSDEARASGWIAAEAARAGWDELDCRALVQLRGRALVFTQWRVIEALAQTLQRDTTVLGADVDRICRELGARQYGTRPVDPVTTYTTIANQRVSLREWSSLLDEHSKDRMKATRALKKKRGIKV